ncbi:MAG TPA: LPS assembly lipoprotein LptE [Steroidobacteraceae bacterium]|nr:LPS assembly lipoprotein LptE [Steroidobacteraceae bacterium]
MAEDGATGHLAASRPAAERSAGRWLLATAVVLLAGCGFHLEGHVPLPQPIRAPYIQALDEQSDFVQSLRREMLISGAHPVDTPDRASAVVDILDDAVTRRVLSVSAQNRPTEYQVTYTVRFRVTGGGGKELLAPQQVVTVRSYSFDESLLLAKEHEEAILQQAMGQDLADIVMRRLSRVSGS